MCSSSCPVQVPLLRVSLAVISWLRGARRTRMLLSRVPSALRKNGQTPPVTPRTRKPSPSSAASSSTPRRHSSDLHAVKAIAGASSPRTPRTGASSPQTPRTGASSPRTPRTNKSDGRRKKRSMVAAAAELAISRDLLSPDNDGSGVAGGDHRGRQAHAQRAQKGSFSAVELQEERGMFSAAWGAVLPRTGTLWKVPGRPWTTDGQAASPAEADSSFRNGPRTGQGGSLAGSNSLSMCWADNGNGGDAPVLQIPSIPLHLLSPPDFRDRQRDGAGEEEGDYSRRSAVQKSALLDAIGEDSVRASQPSLCSCCSCVISWRPHLSKR